MHAFSSVTILRKKAPSPAGEERVGVRRIKSIS
jgi:hypothetical protein